MWTAALKIKKFLRFVNMGTVTQYLFWLPLKREYKNRVAAAEIFLKVPALFSLREWENPNPFLKKSALENNNFYCLITVVLGQQNLIFSRFPHASIIFFGPLSTCSRVHSVSWFIKFVSCSCSSWRFLIRACSACLYLGNVSMIWKRSGFNFAVRFKQMIYFFCSLW